MDTSSVVVGIPQYQLDKLQLIQNNAARVILQQKKYDHVTPTLMALHWLPIEYRITYKILLITFKALHDYSASYITELIKHYIPAHSLHSSNNNLFSQPTSKLNFYGDRSFTVCKPKLWNALPLYL